MSSALPPKTVNGSANLVFNPTDYIPHTDAKYDAKYLPLTGGIVSGALTTNSLTVTNSISTNGIISNSGVNEFDTNITLPTTYSSTPNTALPSSTQLGGYLFAQTATPINASTGTVTAILSLTITAGVWLVCWRGSIFPSATGTGTYTNIQLAFTVNNGIINHLSDVQQRVAISSSQSCTFNATNGYDVSLMGSTIVRPTGNTTYYLNGSSVYTSTAISQWRGHIHAVRIA